MGAPQGPHARAATGWSHQVDADTRKSRQVNLVHVVAPKLFSTTWTLALPSSYALVDAWSTERMEAFADHAVLEAVLKQHNKHVQHS